MLGTQLTLILRWSNRLSKKKKGLKTSDMQLLSQQYFVVRYKSGRFYSKFWYLILDASLSYISKYADFSDQQLSYLNLELMKWCQEHLSEDDKINLPSTMYSLCILRKGSYTIMKTDAKIYLNSGSTLLNHCDYLTY